METHRRHRLATQVLIWETDGEVQLTYNDPTYLARRHGIDESDPVLAEIAKALQRFTSAAAAR